MKTHGVKAKRKRINSITRSELIHILSLTDNGFHDILKKKWEKNNIQLINFNEGINYILENTDLLRSPIIFDEKKLLIGYNSDEIRVFIPKRKS
ncbi:ArsC/Spx/MgsR family protein [Lactococcus petauri]|uniref:ArsC/Spx/MgsR family protein n=1 Tax=Lactococcus petauri TaxID=1940789 RepID=UPI002550CA10|nr:ArsC/Spx/MgsR family protein [Lactococcus petauri]